MLEEEDILRCNVVEDTKVKIRACYDVENLYRFEYHFKNTINK